MYSLLTYPTPPRKNPPLHPDHPITMESDRQPVKPVQRSHIVCVGGTFSLANLQIQLKKEDDRQDGGKPRKESLSVGCAIRGTKTLLFLRGDASPFSISPSVASSHLTAPVAYTRFPSVPMWSQQLTCVVSAFESSSQVPQSDCK